MNLRKNLREPEAHTSALNDILFILLLFFLVISTLANPNVVKVNVPKAESDTKAKQTVVVTIDSLQRIYVGTRLISTPDSLAPAIQAVVAKSQDAEPTVVMNVDKKYSQQIIDVMTAARSLHLRTVMAVDNDKR